MDYDDTQSDDGSTYYRCNVCGFLLHAAPTVAKNYKPEHEPGSDCHGTIKPVGKDAFAKAERKLRTEFEPDVTFEPTPEPEPAAPEPAPEEEPAPVEAEEIPQPSDDDPILPTYADETVVGEEVIDSNRDVVPDVSLFVYQPPEPEASPTPEEGEASAEPDEEPGSEDRT